MNVIRAEWTKLRTTPGPAWLLLATAAVSVATGVALSAVDTRLALSGVYVGQIPLAVLSVVIISSEYSTGLIRTTLTAVPSRWPVLVAKALVLTAAVAVTGSLAVLATLLITGSGQAFLSQASARAVFHLILIALLSLGTASLTRDSAVAIGTVLALLYLPPLLTQLITNPVLRRLLDQFAPMTAHPAILALWSATALSAGTLMVRRRDT
ncbi:ABC transporter permease [Actinoplanes sp. LDG1-01]|uniref:ABC transporter permease n=2 Tax=Paractinoplanes lichenicola TaxID=2802976 RepID=A0ABS1VZ00_9ACTN|nr:ABC transporter permease [Actinoplanes lichenicola]